MAENIEKKVLIEAKVLDNFIAAKKNVEHWRKELKEAQKDETKTAEELRNIAEELAKASVEYRDAKKEVESTAKTHDLLSDAVENTNRTLGEMQRELTALKNTPFTGMDEKQIQNVKQKMADLTAEIQDYKDELKALDTGEVFNNMAEGLEFVTASASGLANGMKILGIESSILGGLEQKTVELIAATQALGVVTEYLEKRRLKLLLANLQNIYLAKKEKVALISSAIAHRLLGKSVDANTLSFKLLRGAIISTGIGALILLIGALIANWGLLTKWFTKSTDGLTGFGKAFNKVKEIAMGVWEVIKNYVLMPFKAIDKLLKGDVKGALMEVVKGYNVIGNYQKGATEQMARNHEAAARRMLEVERKLKSGTLLSDAEKLEKKLEVDRAMGKSASELYREEMKILDKKIQGYKYALSTIKDINSEEYKEMKKNLDDAMQQEAVIRATETKRLVDDGKQRAQKAQESFLKQLDLKHTYDEARLKAEAKYQSDDFATKQQYEQRLFELKEKSEKEKLSAQLKFGKISQTEYQKQLDIMSAGKQEFENAQAKSVNDFYKEKRNEILGLIEQDTQAQIDAVTEKYDKAIQELGEMQQPIRLVGQSDEEYQKALDEYGAFVLNKSLTEIALEREKQAQIDKLKAESIAKQVADIEERIEKEYKGELAKFTDNEREKTKVEIDMLQKRIAEKKAAGLQTFEDEAELRAKQYNLNQIQLNTELLNEQLSAKQKFEAKKAFLEKEREIYKNNADRVKEINAELREVEKEYHSKRIEELEKWADKTMQLLSSISSYMSANEQSELQEYESKNESKKQILQNRLNAGLISQLEYDDKVAKADRELDKKKAAIARRQATREKLIKIFEIGINTASAIVEALPNIPLSVASGIIGAAQLTTVIATPIPKASRGKLLSGNSHASGGILIEAEGGEAIINKRSTSMFAPLLSAINEAGGGVPFMRPMSDGGYTTRSVINNNTVSLDDMRKAMKEAVSEVKVYTTIEDIRREDKNYTRLEQRANY